MEEKVKKKVIWLSLSFLILAAMLLGSCATSTTTSTPTSTTTNATTNTTAPPTTTTAIAPTGAPTTTTTTTTTTGNWWASLGKPQYGGTMTLRVNQDVTNWDPDGPTSTFDLTGDYLERLTVDDWTLNPSVFSYQIAWRT